MSASSKPVPTLSSAAAQVERAYQEEWERIIQSVIVSSRAKREQGTQQSAGR